MQKRWAWGADNMQYTMDRVETEQRSFIAKVYSWMTLALVLTGATAMFTVTTPALLKMIFQNQLVFFMLIIGEVALVMYLAIAVRRMSANTAIFAFLGYSILNGLTLAAIFMIFTAASIASTFFITAATFGIMSIYGYTTKTDLTSVGNLAFMGLLGVIVASVVNIFMHSTTLYYIIGYIGVAVFVGLVAYDTQKIKQMNIIGNAGTDEDKKEAIMGALTLYLDFINLFLLILRFTGKRR